MSNNILDQRWPWLAAAAAIVVAYLIATMIDPDGGNTTADLGADPRPMGSIEDVAALRERDDVNVLFILIDTLRSDRLGSYGHSRDTSPYMDRLAGTGVRFAHHLSQSSWTKASMTSLWTSVYPWRTGVTRFDHIIPEGAELAAETLQKAGFSTIGIWRNGWVATSFGFHQGFDVYVRPRPLVNHANALAENPTLKRGGSDEDATSSAIEFMRVHSGERWFMYLHLMDLHEYTYDSESALFGSEYSDIYDNSIRWVDRTIEILMGHLADQGYAENTLVVVSSDHGEAFMERGFEGHGRRLYKETTEVPFIVSFPFKLDPNIVVETRTQNVDIWPTIFDLIGVERTADQDGRSRVPDIMAVARGESPPEGDSIGFSHLDQNWGQRDKDPLLTVAVSEGSLRYVRGRLGKEMTENLFDASSDPLELVDIAAAEPEAVERLRNSVDERLTAPPAWGEADRREISEMELNHLRAIGYDVGD
jgi:arylsulfatase A-like enzyme